MESPIFDIRHATAMAAQAYGALGRAINDATVVEVRARLIDRLWQCDVAAETAYRLAATSDAGSGLQLALLADGRSAQYWANLLREDAASWLTSPSGR